MTSPSPGKSGPTGRTRVLIVGPRYHTNQHEWVRALVSHGHEVTFVALYAGMSESYELVSPLIPGYGLGVRSALRLVPKADRHLRRLERRVGIPSLGRYVRVFRQYRPDVVLSRNSGLLTVVSALLSRLCGARFVLYDQCAVDAGQGALGPRQRVLFQGLVMLFRRDLMWMSPIRQQPVTEVRGRGWVKSYVPFGAPRVSELRPRSELPHTRLLAIGKFQTRKNHLLLVNAVAELLHDYDLTLTIVGEAVSDAQLKYCAAVQDLVAKRGMADRVTVLTNIPFAEVPTLYLEHDLFVLPARSEPASVAVVEAMAHGLAVVASDSNGTSCYIQPGRTGYVFRTDDQHDLAEKLRSCVADRNLLWLMGRRAYEYAHSELGAEATYSRLATVLRLS